MRRALPPKNIACGMVTRFLFPGPCRAPRGRTADPTTLVGRSGRALSQGRDGSRAVGAPAPYERGDPEKIFGGHLVTPGCTPSMPGCIPSPPRSRAFTLCCMRALSLVRACCAAPACARGSDCKSRPTWARYGWDSAACVLYCVRAPLRTAPVSDLTRLPSDTCVLCCVRALFPCGHYSRALSDTYRVR